MATEREYRRIDLPLPDAPWGVLWVPWPMTDEEWRYWMEMLEIMRPGIVRKETPDAGETGE